MFGTGKSEITSGHYKQAQSNVLLTIQYIIILDKVSKRTCYTVITKCTIYLLWWMDYSLIYGYIWMSLHHIWESLKN